jgi:cytochrome oxidase Cu insertion factor (SCO1/SenC/PrrC family)
LTACLRSARKPERRLRSFNAAESISLFVRVRFDLTFAVAVIVLLQVGCSHLPVRTAELSSACCNKSSNEVSTIYSSSNPDSLVTAWLPPQERTKSLPIDLDLTDQSGRKLRFADLVGTPVAMSFIYTRCTNPNKCARIADTLSQLQRQLVQTGLTNRIILALMTYDPDYDLPERLEHFGVSHGLRFDQGVTMLRPEPAVKDRFFNDWQVAVNYNDGGVNIHGIQLLLFDKEGRWVRTYHTLLWDNSKVVEDLKHLAAERGPGIVTSGHTILRQTQ